MPGDGRILPVSDYAEAPAWSGQSHTLLHCAEMEVDRRDMREVVEVGKGFWEAVSKQGFLTVEGEPQNQPYPGGDTEVVQEDGRCRPCDDREHIQVG